MTTLSSSAPSSESDLPPLSGLPTTTSSVGGDVNAASDASTTGRSVRHLSSDILYPHNLLAAFFLILYILFSLERSSWREGDSVCEGRRGEQYIRKKRRRNDNFPSCTPPKNEWLVFWWFWVCKFSSDGQTDPLLYYPPTDDIPFHPTTTTGREVTLGGGGLPRKMCTVALICDEKI